MSAGACATVEETRKVELRIEERRSIFFFMGIPWVE
jgi:hypothetical protein